MNNNENKQLGLILKVAMKVGEEAGHYLDKYSSQNHKDLKVVITSESAKYYVKYIELGRRIREHISSRDNTKEDIDAAVSIFKFFKASEYFKHNEIDKFAKDFASFTLAKHCVITYGKCLEANPAYKEEKHAKGN